MIEYDRYSWWRTVFSVRGTALSHATGRVLLLTTFAIVVQLTYEAERFLGWFDVGNVHKLDPSGHAVVGSLLGFLIVFRMNASNNRYWEGRSHWGMIINASRNLVRVGCEYTTSGRELADLVSGYVVCLRDSLRGSREATAAEAFLSVETCREAERFGNPPTALAAEVSAWIGGQRRAARIDPQLVRHMETELSKLVESQGGCEKIQKTPLPFAYVAMIKQLILVYLATLPIVLCHAAGWWSPLLVAIASFGLFGMEEASVEIEDPFGMGPNCLDLEAYTATIARDVGQLAARTMSHSTWTPGTPPDAAKADPAPR